MSSTPMGYLAAALGAGAALGSAATFLGGQSQPRRELPKRSNTYSARGHRDRDQSESSYSSPWQSSRAAHTTSMAYGSDSRRAELRRIAEETLTVLREGFYSYKGVDHDLRPSLKESHKGTKYYAPQSSVKDWKQEKASKGSGKTYLSILNISAIDAARLLSTTTLRLGEKHAKVGLLNFASATLPGGGFQTGAEAQEESIARSSTLYDSLVSDEAKEFYRLHEKESAQSSAAFYSHGIIYSPSVTVFRDDDGVWTYPFNIDVLSCAAVNAGEARKRSSAGQGLEVVIEREMMERMGRILYVFEKAGVRNLVLGTFGTG